MPYKSNEERRKYYKSRKKTHKQLLIAYTMEQYVHLQNKAHLAKVSVTELIRDLSLQEQLSTEKKTLLERHTQALNKLIFIIRSISNNTNQIARTCNTDFLIHGKTQTSKTLLNIYLQLSEQLESIEQMITSQFGTDQS